MAEAGGIDYSQYANWQTITAPTGATYYVVPGTGYVYDPFLSNVKGRPVLFTNPTPQVDEKNKAQAEKDAQTKAAKQAASPMGQILPVATSIGGLYAANKVGGWLSGSGGASSGAASAGSTAANTAANAAANTAANTGGGSITQAGTWLGRQADAVGDYFGMGGGGSPASTASTAGEAFSSAALPTPGSAGFIGPVQPAAPGAFSLSGIGSAGNAFLPAAGAVGMYDIFKNDRSGTRGALQGAASGAAIGSYFGPVGTGVGAVIGGTVGYFNRYGDKDMWKTEGNKLKKLQKQGIYVPQGLIDSMPQNKGRSTEELVARAKATGGNVKFAEGRKESDLTPQDIVGYAAFAQNDPDWFKKPLQQRLAVAQQALSSGAVREHHGTVDVDWGKVPDINAAPPPTTPQPGQGAAISRIGTMPQAPSQPANTGGGSVGYVRSANPVTGGPLGYNPGAQATPESAIARGRDQWFPAPAANNMSPAGGMGDQYTVMQPAVKENKGTWQFQKQPNSTGESVSDKTGKALAKRMNDKTKKK
jgi:hypothetical protein